MEIMNLMLCRPSSRPQFVPTNHFNCANSVLVFGTSFTFFSKVEKCCVSFDKNPLWHLRNVISAEWCLAFYIFFLFCFALTSNSSNRRVKLERDYFFNWLNHVHHQLISFTLRFYIFLVYTDKNILDICCRLFFRVNKKEFIWC